MLENMIYFLARSMRERRGEGGGVGGGFIVCFEDNWFYLSEKAKRNVEKYLVSLNKVYQVIFFFFFFSWFRYVVL